MVPLIAAVGVVATRNEPNLREAVSIAAGVVLFLLVATLAATIDWDAPPTLAIAEPIAGVPLALTPEPLGILFALVASLLWPVTTVYAVGYMRAHHEQNQTRFYTAFAVSICGHDVHRAGRQHADAVRVLRGTVGRDLPAGHPRAAPTRRNAPGASTSAC